MHVRAHPQVIGATEFGGNLVQVGGAIRLQLLAVGAQRAKAAAPEKITARILRFGLDALHHRAGAARDGLHVQLGVRLLHGFQRGLDGFRVVRRIEHDVLRVRGAGGQGGGQNAGLDQVLELHGEPLGRGGYLPENSLMRNVLTDTMMGSTITVTSAAP
ncbi:hypothetical protein D3C71_1657980 [compost metagenome]